MNPSSHTSLKVLDSIPALIWQAGTDAKWNFFNKHWLHYTGRSLDDELGHGWVDGVHPGDRKMFVDTYLNHFDAGDPFSAEIRLRHRDRSYRWIVIHGQPIHTSEGIFMGYVGYGHDVTEQKRYSESLKESRQRFQSLARMSPIGVFRLDPEGACHYVSDRWCTIAGVSREKALGLGWLDAIHSDDRDLAIEQLSADIIDSPELSFENRIQKDDGGTAWVRTQLRPELDEYGIHNGYFGSITDLAKDEAPSDNTQRISKFESLGIFAGGIAHDFNNLLTPILLNLSVTQSQMPESHENAGIRQRLQEAEEAAMRARGAAQQLLTFAEDGNPVMKPVDLRELLDESVRFALHGSRINKELVIDENLSPVKIDAGQFSQVIQNLIINAVQAMEHGGTIRVTAENLDALDVPGAERASEPHVAVRVEDQGIGIMPDNLTRIFDPYFSTKTNGTGLGLSTALSIVKKHSGQIRVATEPGLGSAFTIYLPVTSEVVEEMPPLEKRPSNGAIRLLVMDDEDLVLNSMQALLTTLGYKVQTARDGDQALHICRKAREAGQPIDITLMDLTVQGGKGGKETMAELKDVDPEARAVVCSGYSNDPVMANFEDYGFLGAIKKPFQPEELQAVLTRVMGNND